MDIDQLHNKLNKIKESLNNDDTSIIIQNIKNNKLFKNLDNEEIFQINSQYYENLSKHEQIYQKKNEEYKNLISQFSQAYLDLSDFYVGKELPRETFLDTKYDVFKLYLMFWFYAMAEPYLNAYHKKYCL